MSDYASIIKKALFDFVRRTLKNKKKHGASVFLCAVAIMFSTLCLRNYQSARYAHADTGQIDNSAQIKLLMSGDPKDILTIRKKEIPSVTDSSKKEEKQPVAVHTQAHVDKAEGDVQVELPISASSNDILAINKSDILSVMGFSKEGGRKAGKENEDLEKRLYDMVGDSPIREMVPFIAKRDQRTAAFLVGIAKKESSFGFASPSKDGITCFNYWGYKGSAGRGTGMGYACFASAEEAVRIVGDRLGVLVEKKRDTPARMVDTWKCGISCAGDPGAPSWVSTVALYFNKIVSYNS